MSDVVIVGGGPAGLTLGCYLAEAGVPCLILERAHHPRPHVGESLMPSTVRVFREIGFLPVMEAADFPKSGGVVYHPRGREAIEISYAEFPQEGIDQAHTYHVDRSKFDLLLMKHADNLGCGILQGVGVREVTFDDSGFATGVRVDLADQELTLPAKIVVDAAGRATKIGRQLGLRRDHPVLDQLALHAWFVDVDRGKRATRLYTHVYFLPELHGWAWQAPINEEITSVGLVVAKALYQETHRDVGDFFVWALGKNEALARSMRGALRINDLKGEANYSYALERVCGDGWLAIGDAARFIDPVFSSGVSAAVHGARFAAERIVTALESGQLGRESFIAYEQRLMDATAVWDEFIELFYRLLPAFVRVVQSPELRSSVLRLMQGDVDPTAHRSVLHEMRRLVDEVEASEAHDLHPELLVTRTR